MTKPRSLRSRSATHLRVLAFAGAVLLVGCDESVTEPPTPVPATVQVLPSSVELTAIGATAQLTATVMDADGVQLPSATVTWSSSSTAVATVSGSGMVEAVAEGSTTITARSGDATADAQVTVALPAPTPAELVVEPDIATLTEVGATVQLNATVLDATGAEIEGAVVAWASSNAEVASVSEGGLVEALAEGTATITGTSGDVSGTAEITVDLPAPGPAVLISPETLVLTEVGETAELAVTVLDGEGVALEAAVVTWTTSDAEVATVDENGLVEAVGEGMASIMATFGEISGTAEVTVAFAVPSPAEVMVVPSAATLNEIGATAQFMATVLDEDGAEIEGAIVVWTTSDADVAIVGEQGMVEAVGEGTATITATSSEVAGTAEVTVDLDAPSPHEVVVAPEAVTLTEVGATAELTATVQDADGVEIEGSVVVWSTSDTDVAVVGQQGVVTAVGQGIATITAAIGEVSGTTEVTVEF